MKNSTKTKFDLRLVIIAALCLAAVIIIAVIIIAVSGSHNSSETDFSLSSEQLMSENSETAEADDRLKIPFGDIEVEINEDIPQNLYTAENFDRDNNGFITYNGDGALYGIDVSSFQGNVDWSAVCDFGVDFAIIRLGFRGMSEGQLYTDDCFYDNIDGAQEAGIDTGVYFFSQAVTAEEAAEEARYVLEVLDGRKLQYPVIFDWEPGYDAADRTNPLFSSSVVNDFAEEFCRVISDAGYECGIYFNCYQGYLQYDLSRFQDICLWLAEYDEIPEFYYAFNMWQYSCEGTVSGIETPVDLNIYFTEK